NTETCECEHSQPPFVLLLPNAFSPNNDGFNDVLRATYSYPISAFYLAIYNRWGEKVFESHDVGAAWDGTYKGQAVPVGVYAYYVLYSVAGESEAKPLKGNITVVR
ncbi:MAG TPA: gliding motility-associated C-terminal domain-containing protein, partial [Chitinophagales bacterium]|nr:gliding motility-associated C-terminal domain-containing protein [Chitinophagales bacterium]